MTAGLAAAFLGFLLVYSAVKGVHPWAPIVEAFGGSAPPPPGGQAALDAAGGPGPAEQAAVFPLHGHGSPSRPPAGVHNVGGLTPACRAFEAAVAIRWPQATFDGDYNCRRIIPHNGGTSTAWSEHSWGNAVDYTGSARFMRDFTAWAIANKARFRIVNVIPPGSAVNVVHVDFAPSHHGIPPCAGGGR